MQEIINRCPVCNKITSFEKNGKTEKIETVHGICWGRIGYSIGGWGKRNDFIGDFSGEVCDECFTALKMKINELKEVIDQRTNSCEDGICIYRKQNNKSKRDKVSYLQ